MSFKSFIAVCAGKSVRLFCRIVHRGGTAKPGEIALKICPDLLAKLSKNTNCIVITGTNGKTTCNRIVEEGLKIGGYNYFANRSGANLIEGIVTDFIVNSSITGKCGYDWAVLETDEAASKNVCLQCQPKIIYVTNIFRDQVDRFGDVTNTRDWIRAGIKNAPHAMLVLNADCPVTASLADGVANPRVFYGLGAKAADQCAGKGVPDLTDCIECGHPYHYDYITFSHLGKYSCEQCGAERPEAQYEVTDIVDQNISGSVVSALVPSDVSMITENITLNINLPAVYNIYNAIGAFATIREAGVKTADAAKALAQFQCGFGRMEALNIGQQGSRMILIKNDAGCNQVLQFLKTLKDEFVLSFYTNNNISDGVDISWLESAEFEILKDCPVRQIYLSGMCVEAMHDRLLRAGIEEDQLIIEKDCPALIAKLNESPVPVFILPSYTGMMEARNEIIKQFGGKNFWEG